MTDHAQSGPCDHDPRKPVAGSALIARIRCDLRQLAEEENGGDPAVVEILEMQLWSESRKLAETNQ